MSSGRFFFAIPLKRPHANGSVSFKQGENLTGCLYSPQSSTGSTVWQVEELRDWRRIAMGKQVDIDVQWLISLLTDWISGCNEWVEHGAALEREQWLMERTKGELDCAGGSVKRPNANNSWAGVNWCYPCTRHSTEVVNSSEGNLQFRSRFWFLSLSTIYDPFTKGSAFSRL